MKKQFLLMLLLAILFGSLASYAQPTTYNRETDIDQPYYTAAGAEFDISDPGTITYTLTGAITASGSGGSLNGIQFPIGITTVTFFVVNDPVTTQHAFHVHVSDVQSPVITGVVNNQAIVNRHSSAAYTPMSGEFDVSVTDNSGAVTVTYELSGATSGAGSGTSIDGESLNQGATIVTYTATDPSSNTSTYTFYVLNAEEAQVSDSGLTLTYTQTIDSVFRGMTKSRVPYGIFYDRVFPIAGLTEDHSADTLDSRYFIQAYSELQRADYSYTHIDTILDHTHMLNYLYSENMQHRIPVMALNYNFSELDTNAFTDGRLDTLGGYVHDGTNSASPCITHHIAMPFCGVVLSELDSGVTYQLQFSDDYEFGNSAVTVNSITIYNATTAQTWSLDKGDDVLATFNTPGNNYLTLTATLSNNTTRLLKLLIRVSAKKATAGPCTSDPNYGYTSGLGNGNAIHIKADIAFQGDVDDKDYYGEGDYTIFYHDASCTLGKPVIILDGFDPAQERDAKSIYDILGYTDAAGTQNLGNKLRSMGYDIIILDAPQYIYKSIPIYSVRGTTRTIDLYRSGGGDYIERNAFVLIKLINDLKARMDKDGNPEKFVVIGPSMGGQISRLALKFMEDNGWNHNTRLWISFDSPHWGANIPVGFQEMLRSLAKKFGDSEAEESYNSQLQCPAAREMLIHQTDPGGAGSTAYSNALNDNGSLRAAWKNTLQYFGYPNNLRKIAIANGTWTGWQYYSPSDEILKLRGYGVLPGTLNALTGHCYFFNTTYNKIAGFEYNFLATKANTVAGSIIRALVAIFSRIPIPNTAHYDIYGNTTLSYGAFDAANGGTYTTQRVFYKNAHKGSGVTRVDVDTMTNKHNFIPTASALGMNFPWFDWRNSLDMWQVICNNETPFNNIYVPDENLEHVQITEDIASFTIQEIIRQGNNASCPKVCARAINGDNHMALNQVKTFSLNGSVPSTATLHWGLSTGLQAMSYPTSTSISVKCTAVTGWAGVYVWIDNSCGGDVTFHKDLTTSMWKTDNDDKDTTHSNNNIVWHNPAQESGIDRHTIDIYPNPADDVWNVSFNGYSNVKGFSATVSDFSGRQVWQYHGSGFADHLKINSNALAKGVYLLKVNIDGVNTVHKLIK